MRGTARTVGTWAVAMVIGTAGAPGVPARDDPESPAEPKPIEAGEIPRPAPKIEAPRPDEPETARKLDALLQDWERRSAELGQLDAGFRRVDRKLGTKGVTHFEGRALMKGPRLSCLNVDKVQRSPDPDAAARKNFYERVIRTVDGAVKYDGVARQIVFFPDDQTPRDGTPRRGPLPFLLGVKAAELRANYRIKLLDEGRDAFRVEFTPRTDLGSDDEGKVARLVLGLVPWSGVDGEFSRAVVDLNRETLFPDAMLIASPDGRQTQTYVFKEIKANVTVAADNFRVRNIAGWAVVRPPHSSRGARSPPDRAAPATAIPRPGPNSSRPARADGWAGLVGSGDFC